MKLETRGKNVPPDIQRLIHSGQELAPGTMDLKRFRIHLHRLVGASGGSRLVVQRYEEKL